MAYDQSVDMQNAHGPVQAAIVIRSQQGNNRKPPTANVKPRSVFGANNGQRIDIDKFAQRLSGVKAQSSGQKCAKSVRCRLAQRRSSVAPVAFPHGSGTAARAKKFQPIASGTEH